MLAMTVVNEGVNKMKKLKKLKQFEDASFELVLFYFDVITSSSAVTDDSGDDLMNENVDDGSMI